MSIFSKKVKKDKGMDTKYLGVHVQRDIHSCLTLISTAHRIPKTTLVQDIFDEWYRKNWVATGQRDSIVKEIADIAFYDYLKKNNNHTSDKRYEYFICEVREDLQRMELSQEIVNEIIDAINEKKSETFRTNEKKN